MMLLMLVCIHVIRLFLVVEYRNGVMMREMLFLAQFDQAEIPVPVLVEVGEPVDNVRLDHPLFLLWREDAIVIGTPLLSLSECLLVIGRETPNEKLAQNSLVIIRAEEIFDLVIQRVRPAVFFLFIV